MKATNLVNKWNDLEERLFWVHEERKPQEMFEKYLLEQEEVERQIVVAEGKPKHEVLEALKRQNKYHQEEEEEDEMGNYYGDDAYNNPYFDRLSE